MIKPSETWDIQDATKIQAYMDCPRKYFYEYVLGWRPEGANIHLEFGSAWHSAMEHLILHGYDDISILGAYEKFVNYYRQFFSELVEDQYHPKTPAMALKGLLEYAVTYKHDSFKPLYTEIAGTVSLNEQHTVTFKMDSILETKDGVKSREHKTGSQLSRPWMDQWALKMQTGIYNHVLCCLFGPENVWGVEINGAIFSKKEIKFQRVPARRNVQGMEAWYHNTIAWLDDIASDFRKLHMCEESDNTLRCFKQNTESCTKYFGCKYHDFCLAWANPLQHIDQVPMGFIIDHWNPKEEEAKHTFEISNGGEVKIDATVEPTS